MRFFNMPPQIFRLVLLIFAIVVSYLVARTLLTPDTFRDHGFYRGAALVELTGKIPVLAGKEACGARHPEILKTLAKGSHKSLSCEGCHGAVSKSHLDDPTDKMRKPPAGICLRCHEANPSRPAGFKQIVLHDPKPDNNHYDGACLECHLPHDPKEAPAEPDQASPAPDKTSPASDKAPTEPDNASPAPVKTPSEPNKEP